MTPNSESSDQSLATPKRSHTNRRNIQVSLTSLALFLLINILIISLLAWPLIRSRVTTPVSINIPGIVPASSNQFNSTGLADQITNTAVLPTPTDIATQTSTHLPTAIPTQEEIIPVTEDNFQEQSSTTQLLSAFDQGTVILSLSEAGHNHLYSFNPFSSGFTRLTEGPWDDIAPAPNPDFTYIAFSSNRDRQWDLYLLELANGQTVRLTNTPEFDGSPSWSPDGRFISFETYIDDNLEIAIIALPGEEDPIQITYHPDADFSPKWSPKGRQLAFVSTRQGDRDIWLADLNQASDEHYVNIRKNIQSTDSNPTWSPDGESLAWASIENGIHSIYMWQPGEEPKYIGSGDWPVWSPDGSTILTTIETPDQTLLTAYNIESNTIALPPIASPGKISGLAWTAHPLIYPLPAPLAQSASYTPTPLWLPALNSPSDIPAGRQGLVTLEEVKAPYPQLHDLVDESFQELRKRVAFESGWDLLATLENAFVPLTVPLPPGMEKDWLYTGRAFAFTPIPINAGWIVVVPEQFGPDTYWRVYLRARFQDGSQGKPLQFQPWDFNIRFNGDQLAYEHGGALVRTIPSGYWIDFTDLAMAFDWNRLPALGTWRSVYPASHWNEFVLTDGQDWETAMLELYPPEALITPTIIIPPTITPKPTSPYYPTPTPSITPTPWPSLTPIYPSPTQDATAIQRISTTKTITPSQTLLPITVTPNP